MKNKKKPSKTAIAFTGIYLLALIASVFVMFTATGDTSMGGIFLVVISVPWPIVLTKIQDAFFLDSMMFNTIFLIAGGLLNAVIIYKLFSFVTNSSNK